MEVNTANEISKIVDEVDRQVKQLEAEKTELKTKISNIGFCMKEYWGECDAEARTEILEYFPTDILESLGIDTSDYMFKLIIREISSRHGYEVGAGEIDAWANEWGVDYTELLDIVRSSNCSMCETDNLIEAFWDKSGISEDAKDIIADSVDWNDYMYEHIAEYISHGEYYHFEFSDVWVITE